MFTPIDYSHATRKHYILWLIISFVLFFSMLQVALAQGFNGRGFPGGSSPGGGGGGGGGMAIGDPVAACLPNSALFCDAAGNLAQQNPGYTYDSVSEVFQVNQNAGADNVFEVGPTGVVMNAAGGNYDLRVDGVTVPNLLLCDASAETVSVAGNTVLGDAAGDTVVSNAASWSFPNDTSATASNKMQWYGTYCWGATCALNDPPGDATKPHLFEITNDATTQQVFKMATYGATASLGGQNNMHFIRMGGTAAAPTQTLANDVFFSMGARGYSTSVTPSAGAIQWMTPSDWTAGSTETQIIVEGTASGSTTRRRNMTLNGSGQMRLTRNSSYTPYRTNAVMVIDQIQNSGTSFGIPLLMQIDSTQTALAVMGESTTNESYWLRYGSAVAGNYAGTSVALADSTNVRGGPTSDQTMVVSGTPIVELVGTTGTNAATRLDANGLRIGTVADVHTANTNKLEVGGNALITGNTTLGDSSGDSVTCNASTITLTNDTNFVLSGGVNGVSFDTNVLSIDATNNRVGINTTTPGSALDITGSINSTGNITVIGNMSMSGSANSTNLGVFSVSDFIGGAVSTGTTLTGDENDYAGVPTNASFGFRLSGGAADRTITGMVPITTPGTRLIQVPFCNIGTTNSLLFTNEDAASSAVNRILTPGGTTYTLVFGACATFYYDAVSARWRISQ